MGCVVIMPIPQDSEVAKKLENRLFEILTPTVIIFPDKKPYVDNGRKMNIPKSTPGPNSMRLIKHWWSLYFVRALKLCHALNVCPVSIFDTSMAEGEITNRDDILIICRQKSLRRICNAFIEKKLTESHPIPAGTGLILENKQVIDVF